MGIFLISSLVSTFLFTIQPVFYKQLIDTVSLKEIASIFPVIITYSIVRFAAKNEQLGAICNSDQNGAD